MPALPRDEWVSRFTDALVKLRPYLAVYGRPPRLVMTMALQAYGDGTTSPEKAAQEQHKRMEPAP